MDLEPDFDPINGKSKRKFTPRFKLKVVLEILKEKETLAVISKRYERHPNQISDRVGGPVESSFSTAHRLYLRIRPSLLNQPGNPVTPYSTNRLDGSKWS